MAKISAPQFYQRLTDYPTLDDLEIEYDLACRIDGGEKTFNNCSFHNWALEARAQIIVFNNCSFRTLDISLTQSIDTIRFNNCFCGGVKFTGNNAQLGSLEITGSETNIDNLDFKGVLKCHRIKMSELKRISRADLNVNCRNIEMSQVKLIEFMTLGGEVSKLLDISKCTNLKFFSIQKMKCERLEVSDSSDSEIMLDESEINQINFNRSNEISIETTYLKSKHLGLNEGTFNTVEFFHDATFNFDTSGVKEPVKIKSLLFSASNIPKDHTLNLENVTINEVTFSRIYNEGLIQFLNCQIDKRLTFENSNVGKIGFTNVRSDKCRIDILDSNVNDVLFNGFRWNSSYSLFEGYDAWISARYKPELNFRYSLRESYRQLKANYLKNGNKIESLEFQKREMGVHFEILRQEKFNSWRNFGNYLIVGTNKWFSDFGQNIWKPMIGLFVAHLVLFNLVLASFDLGISPTFSLSEINNEALWKGVNLYFHTILPTHFATVKDFHGKELSIAGLWDFLDRILTGYFIFYFISASRKYHQ